MHARANSVIQKLRSSLRINGWLAGQMLRHSGGGVAAIVALSFLGVLARMLLIGLVLLFIEVQTSAAPVGFRGLSVVRPDSASALALWVAAALLLALATASMTYGAEALTYRVAHRNVRMAVGRVCSIIGRREHLKIPADIDEAPATFIRRLLSRNMMMLLRSGIVILRVFTPMFTFIFAVAWLIWVNAALTGLVVLTAAVYVVPFYLLNRQLVRSSREREEVAPVAARTVGDVTSFLMQRGGAYRADDNRWTQLCLHEGAMERGLLAMRNIILSSDRVTFLQDVLLGAVIVILLLLSGVFITDGGFSWSRFLIYVIALRFASTAMNRAAGLLTRTNRFLPQVRRYVDFCRINPLDAGASAPREIREDDEGQDLPELRVAGDALPGSRTSLRLRRGEVLLCIWPPAIDAVSHWQLCLALTGRRSRTARRLRDRMFFLGRGAALPPVSVAEVMTGDRAPGADQRRRIDQIVEQAGLRDAWQELPDGLETILWPQVVKRLPRPLTHLLSVAEGILGDWEVVVLDAEMLMRFSSAVRDRMLALLEDRVVILLASSKPQHLPQPVDRLLVADTRQLLGIGDRDWFEHVAATQHPSLVPTAAGLASGEGCRLDDEAADDILDDE